MISVCVQLEILLDTMPKIQLYVDHIVLKSPDKYERKLL